MRDKWFGPILKAAGQQPLWCEARPETYRVMWLPAFLSAYVVTISEESGEWIVSARQFVDPSSQVPPHRDPYVLVTESERKLVETELRRFASALRAFDFWRARLYTDNREVMDGWAMVMEGRQGGVYRVLTRINANDAAFASLARTMIEIARLPVPQPIETLSNQARRAPLPQ